MNEILRNHLYKLLFTIQRIFPDRTGYLKIYTEGIGEGIWRGRQEAMVIVLRTLTYHCDQFRYTSHTFVVIFLILVVCWVRITLVLVQVSALHPYLRRILSVHSLLMLPNHSTAFKKKVSGSLLFFVIQNVFQNQDLQYRKYWDMNFKNYRQKHIFL